MQLLPLIHTLFSIREIPTGGGNQFLRALHNELRSRGWYAEDPKDANVFLYNSFQYIPDVLAIKRGYPERIFVHRIDGPIRLYNNPNDYRDRVTNSANEILADGTIFQSKWSRRENYRLGLKPKHYQAVIPNAPDPIIFHKNRKVPFSKGQKIRLIATSWSLNWKKGFKTYQWLDEHLDFGRFEMTFIGKSPISFKNVRHLSPLASHELADEFRSHDICIFASEYEACSNTILEALACGLPTIARNSSSNPEVLGEGGELFDHAEEIPELIENIAADYEGYQKRICVPLLEEIAELYYDFMSGIYKDVKGGYYTSKNLTSLKRLRIRSVLWWWRSRGWLISWVKKSYSLGRFLGVIWKRTK